jgi:hypothetical protein
MRSLTLALIAAVALAGAATRSVAQTTPADRADARCLLVLEALARDPRNKEAAGKGVFYYLGRLQARGLAARLGPLFREEAKAMPTPQQAQAEAKRCTTELTARSNELRSVFQALAAAQPAAAPPPK